MPAEIQSSTAPAPVLLRYPIEKSELRWRKARRMGGVRCDGCSERVPEDSMYATIDRLTSAGRLCRRCAYRMVGSRGEVGS